MTKKQNVRGPGRPPLRDKNKKKPVSVRLTDIDKKFLIKEYGSIQEAIESLLDMVK